MADGAANKNLIVIECWKIFFDKLCFEFFREDDGFGFHGW